MKIILNGYVLSMDEDFPAQFSGNIPVEFENDSIYEGYTPTAEIRFHQKEKMISRTLPISNGSFSLPAEYFKYDGKVMLSVMNTKGDMSINSYPIIATIKSSASGEGSLPERSVTWQSFVTEYIDNQLMPERIEELVNNYLEENPVEITTDTSLSAIGQAADAKAVGDKISDLEKLAITQSASGTQIVAKDSAEWPVQALTVYGRTEQDKTTGKNIVNCMDNKLATFTAGEGSLTGHAWGGVVFDNAWVQKNLKPSTTYYGSMSITMIKTVTDKTVYDLSKNMLLYRSSTSSAGAYSHSVFGIYKDAMTNGECVNVKINFTTPADLTDLTILAYTERYTDDDRTGEYLSTVTFSDIMLSEAEMPYEPYTGGKPSPSPDYPQEIVSAGQVLTTVAQLFNKSDVTLTSGTSIDQLETGFRISGNARRGGCTAEVQVNPQTTYYLDVDIKNNSTNPYISSDSSPRVFVYTKNSSSGVETLKTAVPISKKQQVIAVGEDDIIKFVFAYNWINGPALDDESGDAEFANIMLSNTANSEYEPYTGDVHTVITRGIELTVGGKNLFDVSQIQSNSKLIVNGDGSLTAKGYASSTNKKLEQLCPGLMIGCTYTMSMKTTGLNSICLYNDSATVAANMWKDGGSKVITQDMLYAEVLLYCKRDSDGNNSDATISDIQIELGSTVTAYESYRPIQTATIASANGLPGIPVSSGGNYTDESGQQWVCDTIEYKDGQAVYVKRVAEYAFTGNETLIDYLKIDAITSLLPHKSDTFALCTHATFKTSFTWANDNYISFVVSAFNVTTVEDFRTWLTEQNSAGDPLRVLYAINTPTETPLTDTEAAQLAALHTYKPTTTVTNDAGVGMDMTYIADTKVYIDNKFAELQTALATTNAQLI